MLRIHFFFIDFPFLEVQPGEEQADKVDDLASKMKERVGIKSLLNLFNNIAKLKLDSTTHNSINLHSFLVI